MNRSLNVGSFLHNLVVASIFASPDDHGLTADELFELGAAFDFKRGELQDGLRASTHAFERRPDGRYGADNDFTLSNFFGHPSEDDPRNLDAFDFVWCLFRELDREAGAGKGCIDKDVLLNRAKADALEERDVRVAIAIYTLTGRLKPDGARLLSGKRTGWSQSPKEQLDRIGNSGSFPYPNVTKYMAAVSDIIRRRTDGRSPSPEPLRAYPSALESLGLPGLVPWWQSVAAELRSADPQTSPTTVIVLSAALAEAALCSLLERAKTSPTSMAKGALWNQDPKKWKFITLLKEARSGDDPVFGDDERQRAERLNDLRQRIHAGRFWPARPAKGFDLNPEEARESRETLDRILRAALEWLARQA